MYKLLQNQAVSNLHNEINKLGWGAAAEQYPEVKAHFDATMGADKFSNTYIKFYTMVAEIDVSDVEEAFHVHNIQDESKITRYGTQHSMSVGDILVAEDGGMYFCDRYGFSYIGQDTKEYTIPARSVIA